MLHSESETFHDSRRDISQCLGKGRQTALCSPFTQQIDLLPRLGKTMLTYEPTTLRTLNGSQKKKKKKIDQHKTCATFNSQTSA